MEGLFTSKWRRQIEIFSGRRGLRICCPKQKERNSEKSDSPEACP